MNRSARLALLACLLTTRVAGASDPVASLADQAYPEVSLIAKRLTLTTWDERAGMLVTAAPSATAAGERWRPGDSHWESAKRKLLANLERWTTDLVEDSQAKQIVRQSFARNITAAQAEAISPRLAAEATKDFPTMQDSIHLGALFMERHPEIKIGSPDFSKALNAWMKQLESGQSFPKESPELTALMKSAEGMAYGRARASSIDSLARGLDGQIQLRIHDTQAALLEEIGSEAKACAAAHD